MQVHDMTARLAAAALGSDPMGAVREELEAFRQDLDTVANALAYLPGTGGNARQAFYRTPELSLLKVTFPAGRRTPPHDHGTWAVVAGIEGVERNVRYNRVDDNSRAGYAELEEKHAFDAAPGELVCMKTGGIHKVTNETDEMTLSLHTYGRHINHTDRAQFNLETNEKQDFKLHIE